MDWRSSDAVAVATNTVVSMATAPTTALINER